MRDSECIKPTLPLTHLKRYHSGTDQVFGNINIFNPTPDTFAALGNTF